MTNRPRRAERIAAPRCEGRYPVPGRRDEPFEVTYRCGLPVGHLGEHGSGADEPEALPLPREAQEPQRRFPIQRERGAKPHLLRIPWSVAEKAYAVYAANYGTSQSLERLAERGGFAPSEMDAFHPSWREETDEIAALRARAEQAEHRITDLEAHLADQRAELTGQFSEAFRAVPECYDTPADHYREMARRLVEDRDLKKHQLRAAEQRIIELEAQLANREALDSVLMRQAVESAQRESEAGRQFEDLTVCCQEQARRIDDLNAQLANLQKTDVADARPSGSEDHP